MNKAKDKAIEVLKSDIDFQNDKDGEKQFPLLNPPDEYHTFSYPIIEKAIDIAIKEIIEDRDRIHTINLECARQGTRKGVFDDEGCHVEGAIAKALEEYGVKKNSFDMAFFIMKKLNEEFNSSNTDEVKK